MTVESLAIETVILAADQVFLDIQVSLAPNHVSPLVFCMIFMAFWQHKFDIKRLFKGRNFPNWGLKCLNFRINLT